VVPLWRERRVNLKHRKSHGRGAINPANQAEPISKVGQLSNRALAMRKQRKRSAYRAA
jgi:hypothetical protein